MPEQLWDDSEIYLALGRGEALVDTGGADDLLDALAKKNTGTQKTVLEAEHGLHDKLAWDAEATRQQKGVPRVAPLPLQPNRNVTTPTPVEGAPVANDNPQTQGAPDVVTPPQDLIVLETTGQSDHPPVNGKVPSIYYLDRLHAIPADEVVNLVDPPPATVVDYDEMVRRTLTNAPMPSQPDPSARPFARKPSTAGEPVDLFSGAFVIDLCDLVVPSPHIPIALTRFYRSGRPYFGPFGYGWDHSYNVYLRPLEGGAFALWTGQLREVQFILDGVGLQPEPGFGARLEPLAGVTDVYDVVFAGGLTWRFERPVGWSHPERIPLTAITDRHGNEVRLTYNSINAVESVVDSAGRGLFFDYGSCALLERVSDHSASRVVSYQHDTEIEHLVRVVLPATANYPTGLRATYDYDRFNSHPAMQHNILRIHDAQDRVTVENFYAGPEAGWEFNAVVYQRTAGFEYRFEYQQIQYVWPDAANADVLATRTLVRPSDGALHTYTFNYRGDLLDHRVRLNRDGSYRVVASQWQHDSEGNIVEAIGPDGLRSIFTFDSANPDPCARRNLLRVERVSPLPSIVTSRIVFEARYDPRYQLIVSAKDEAFAETTYRYDFDLSPFGASGRLAQIRLPSVTQADSTSQQSVHSYVHDSHGRLAAAVTAEGVRTELGYFGAGPHAGLLSSITIDPGGANLITALDYDSSGFIASVTAPGARITGFKFNALGQLEETLLPTVAGANGALRQWFDDSGAVVRVERPVGSYNGNLEGTAIVDEYDRDELGNLRGIVQAANTIDRRAWRQCVDHEGRAVSMLDPLGTRTNRLFGEDGMLLSETVAVGDPAARKTSYSYDRAGRVTHIVDSSSAQTEIEYDVWGRPHRITLPSGAVRILEYGMNDVLVEERAEDLSGATFVVRRRRRFEHDRRGRLVAETVFSFGDNPAIAVPITTRYVYDRDDHLRELLLHRGGRHAFKVDSAGRPSEQIDNNGNVRRFGYDAAGDLTEVTLIDLVGSSPRTRTIHSAFDVRGRLEQAEFLDALTQFDYDDRDLAIRQRLPTGVVKQFDFDAHGQIVASVVDPGGLALRSACEYDMAGRLQRYIDPMTMATTWERDALGQPTAFRPPDGTTWKYTIDAPGRSTSEQTPAGNLLQRRIVDAGGRVVHTTTAPGPGQQSVPVLEHVFDGLGRLVQATAGADRVERRYDSLDRLTEETARGKTVQVAYDDAAGTKELIYPDGRRERSEYSAEGQPTRVVLVSPGSLGGLPGDVLLEIFYLAAGMPARVVYGNGVEALMARDDHDRVIRVDYTHGGTLLDSCRLRFDDHGHHAVVQHLGAPPTNRLHVFDGDDRLVEARSGFALAPLADTTDSVAQLAEVAAARLATAAAPRIGFVLDEADTRRQVNGPVVVQTYASDTDHRVKAAGSTVVAYNADGHRIRDAQYTYELDALNRVTRLRDVGTNAVVAELNYDALSRVSSGATDGRMFERWFAGVTRIHEVLGPGAGLARQYSAHPLWPVDFSVVDGTGPAYIHQDQGWSTMCVTDAGGAVLERHRYGVFGDRATFAADGVTGLASLRTEATWRAMASLGNTPLFLTPHRLYDPELGVFTSRDSRLYADSPSPYAYAAHNPADYADPSGRAKAPLGKRPASSAGEEQPSLGDRILDDLGSVPGSPLSLRKDVKTVIAMVRAFNAEKSVGGGLAMAVNVVNPLYHAEVARFRSGEAADAGHYGEATAFGGQAALGYLQTLTMAMGIARGFRATPIRPVLPEVPFEPFSPAELDKFAPDWGSVKAPNYYQVPIAATEAGVPVERMVPVSRWGKRGLWPGSWIVPGEPSKYLTYARSFKWEDWEGWFGPRVVGIAKALGLELNEVAPRPSGQGFMVPPESIKWPPGIGPEGLVKGLWGQRKYWPDY